MKNKMFILTAGIVFLFLMSCSMAGKYPGDKSVHQAKAEQADRNKTSRVYHWSKWITGNPKANIHTTIITFDNYKVIGLQCYEQPGYGIINLRFIGKDYYGGLLYPEPWTSANFHFDAYKKTVFINENDTVIGLSIKEQKGYGLVDARLIVRKSNNTPGYSGWLTNNNHKDAKIIEVSNYYKEVYALDVKEQQSYGLIDARVGYRDKKQLTPIPNYKGYWSDWSNKNMKGYENPRIIPGSVYINGFECYEQIGYGIINMRLVGIDKNGYENKSSWSNDNFHKNKILHEDVKFNSVNTKATSIIAREQNRYGLIDARLESGTSATSWLTNNNHPAGFYNDRISARPGFILGGLQTREQDRYGIINLRVFFRKN